MFAITIMLLYFAKNSITMMSLVNNVHHKCNNSIVLISYEKSSFHEHLNQDLRSLMLTKCNSPMQNAMLRSSLHMAIAARQFNRFFHRSAPLESGEIRQPIHRSRILTQRRCSKEHTLRSLSHTNYIDQSWFDLLDEMRDPKTRELIQRLDFAFPLGVDPKNNKDV